MRQIQAIVSILVIVLVSSVSAIGAQVPDYELPATPENVVWGWYPIDRAPVLTIASGETVRIDTLTHAGSTQAADPERYLGQLGIAPNEVLQDVIDFWNSKDARPREGRGPHLITGPIYIDGAEPGDMLEIEVVGLRTRVPYGVNTTGSTTGVFDPEYPGSPSGGEPPYEIPRIQHLIRSAIVNGQEVALFSDEIQVPLAPFMGVMAVAPESPTVGQPGVLMSGVQGSRPPGTFGGNLDVKDLTVGSKLYLPVFHTGAQFYVGDPHSVQGDGEVSGTAIEQSLSGDFRFVLHKDQAIDTPWAETATHYIVMGIDLDLDRALRKAVIEVVDFLVEERGLSRSRAYSLASIAVDFRIAEAVDLTQVVTGFLPKSVFVTPDC